VLGDGSLKARSSGGERYPDTVEVVSSNLTVPTMKNEGATAMAVAPFLLFATIYFKKQINVNTSRTYPYTPLIPHFPLEEF
jgi:hypothetical protein